MLRVRPGTSLDTDAAVALWQRVLAEREQRSGGRRAQRFRDRLRSPRALLLLAEDPPAPPVGLLLAELGRADAEGDPVGDGDGPPVPGLLHVGVLVALPGSTARRALLSSVTGRFPWTTAWAAEPDAGAFELAGFTRTGRLRGEGGEVEVHLERRAQP